MYTRQGYPVIDAIRIADGKMVCLKHVPINSHPNEAAITGFLGSPELLKNPRNHCVLLYEVLDVPLTDEEPAQLLVLPFLRPWDDPPLLTVGEAVDLIRQMLEVGGFACGISPVSFLIYLCAQGMSFVHDNAIAHR